MANYMAVCLRTLRTAHDAELLIYHYPIGRLAPYHEMHFADLGWIVIRNNQSAREMLDQINSFSPRAVLMSGWLDRGYMKVARVLRRGGVPIIAGCDRQWTGTIKQRVGQLIAPWYLHTAIDVLWVPGERQSQLASRLGYDGGTRWRGVYCCDWSSFAQIGATMRDRPHAFLYVGRYIEEKGIEQLVEAYRLYRDRSSDPWTLMCVGTGPEAYRLTEVDGIRDMGFVQPRELPDLMGQASAFVLPSKHEPWGVVIQEAAAAGLPLICSDACGATDDLLRDGQNGFLVEKGSIESLADAMVRLSKQPGERLASMGRHSFELSKQFTPEKWAKTLVDGIERMRSAQ